MDANIFTTKIYEIIIPSDDKKDFNSIFILMDYWEHDLVGLLKVPEI